MRGQRHAPAAPYPGKDPIPIVQDAGWASGPVWTGAEILASTEVRSPDRPARRQTLYRLRYPAHSPKSLSIKINISLNGMQTLVFYFHVPTCLRFLFFLPSSPSKPLWPVFCLWHLRSSLQSFAFFASAFQFSIISNCTMSFQTVSHHLPLGFPIGLLLWNIFPLPFMAIGKWSMFATCPAQCSLFRRKNVERTTSSHNL